MKKLTTIAALLGAASLTFGQGVVNFSSGTVKIAINATVGGPSTAYVSGAGSYYFALLEAPTTQTTVDNSLAGWQFTGNYGTNSASGRFTGNYTADPGVTIGGLAPGSTANFVIVGWSANIGPTWADAMAAWNGGNTTAGAATVPFFNFGISSVAANNVLGGGAIPVPTLMGTVAGTQAGAMLLGLQPVPEPTTFALAGLGAAALMIFRRRK